MFKNTHRAWLFLLSLLLVVGACSDPYPYDDKEPDWLGSSIYDYLVEKGEYTYFTRIIDTCNYREVLAKTGSKTMFVCKDSAFEEYFRKNTDGISRFEDFSVEQLNQIMEYAMVNDASLIETLSYAVGYVKGQVMRRATSLDPFDMLSFEQGDEIPKNKYFEPYREKGLYILNDDTSPTLIHFFEAQMKEKGITDEDFSILFNGKTRQTNDAHLFGIKVIERDITCKNGYIHVLESLMLPRDNMAGYIRKSDSLSIFASLMDRFSAPYYTSSGTELYKTLHPEFRDSIFVRNYFQKVSGTSGAYSILDPNGELIPSDELLRYDPGWNSYQYTSLSMDMGAMFVPDDDAMKFYFSPEGNGSFLHERYKVWDSVPNDIVAMFINAHMKYSFISSVPSKFQGLKDEDGFEIGIEKDNILRARVLCNGAVYVTNEVFPPVDYASVMAPVLVNERTQIFNFALRNLDFNIYLRSLESFYSFLVPFDESFTTYLYPAGQGHETKKMIKLKFNTTSEMVDAVTYTYDDATGQLKDSINVVSSAIALDCLNDIMDYHIVVGDIESGQEYYQTKGKGEIRVQGSGIGMKVWGGGNMEMNRRWGSSWDDNKYTGEVTDILNLKNGKTYFVSNLLQQPITSVYKTLSNQPEFSKFLSAMMGVPDDMKEHLMLTKDPRTPGLDFNINFFSAFHYTLYAPNNAAMDRAYAAGLPTWDQIAAVPTADDEGAKRAAMIQKVARFLKYHFQDNSVYIGGELLSDVKYETATKNNITNKFHSLRLTQDGSNITIYQSVSNASGIETFNRPPVQVHKANGLYNLMARDYFFNCATPGDLKSATTTAWTSRTVIHEVDTYFNPIKVPTIRMNNPNYVTTALVPLTADITDNGDGVAYDKNIITKRGFCWSYSKEPEWSASGSVNQAEVAAASDIVNFKYTLNFPASSNPADTLLYIRAYTESKWAVDGSDGTLEENASKKRLSAYSRELCINTKKGTIVY
ncbi:MAG: fasciclin domain-containing protein [Bacteroidales bacterium]|jgi:uncharacterized surface protein with fasciclin (FAS1) repeats|nr:fasciclin domain-containing protein [Bacteroidales bacterium]MBP8981751.1 fasciclin domain-containing protein [Bacteroidales bacterium]HNZ81134.1 fasciclin domain-containing protein [Bacteroidales bacterium]HPY57994.1 fasciclin domain-containing protein [Bacteroidales bacterium]HQB70375.1 fasciclin domain-containing protein [Bacteroidales bacterium]